MTVGRRLRRLHTAARVAAARVFYRLPPRWRRRVVRLLTPGYTVGAVVLVYDGSAGSAGTATGFAGTGGDPAGACGQAADDRMLLLRQPPGFGWSLPGGLLNRGEPPAAGAARELREETGVEVDPGQLRPAVPNAVVHTRGRWIDMVFEVTVRADGPFRVDPAEVHEAAWHPLAALPQLTWPTARLLARYGIGPLAHQPVDD